MATRSRLRRNGLYRRSRLGRIEGLERIGCGQDEQVIGRQASKDDMVILQPENAHREPGPGQVVLTDLGRRFDIFRPIVQQTAGFELFVVRVDQGSFRREAR